MTERFSKDYASEIIQGMLEQIIQWISEGISKRIPKKVDEGIFKQIQTECTKKFKTVTEDFFQRNFQRNCLRCSQSNNRRGHHKIYLRDFQRNCRFNFHLNFRYIDYIVTCKLHRNCQTLNNYYRNLEEVVPRIFIGIIENNLRRSFQKNCLNNSELYR